MIILTVKDIVLISAATANLILGFLVYWNDRKNFVNRIFFLLASSIALWSVASIVFYFSEYTLSASLTLGRLLYSVPIIIVTLLYYFICAFPTGSRARGWRFILTAAFSALLVLLTIKTDLVVKDIVSVTDYKDRVFGSLFGAYALYIIAYVIISIYLLIIKYNKGTANIKIHIRYILIGMGSSAVLGIITGLIFPWLGIFNVGSLSPTTTVIMVAFIAYAISKYNFLNIKIIATQFFVIVLSFLLFINMILSDDAREFIVKLIAFAAVSFVGYLLIRSASREVIIRHELEDLTVKLQKANEDLRRLDAAKSEFLSIASHQLRTPLSIIKGYASVILEGDMGKINDRQKDCLGKIYKSNEKLIMLVSDLLNLSRIESGRIVYNFNPIFAAVFTENIIEELRPKAVAKNLTLKFNKEACDNLLVISVDKNALTQALSNIIDNGIRYTEHGAIEVNLTIDNRHIIWKIKDTGAGINDEEKKNLFQKMKRGERIARLYTEGTGLGLYVAKKIIDAHNGSIWAESEGAGKGSVFYVKIPIDDNK